jgi:phage-related minor tail protein
MAGASQNIARLGVVLGLDSGELVKELSDAQKKFKNFTNEIRRDTNDAAKMTLQLEEATRSYGKTLTKVEEIQQQIDMGRFKHATETTKKALLERAAAYDKVAQAAQKANQMETKKGGLTPQQQAALGYQTTDIVTSLAGGQNPLMVLLQQGGQLRDQFGGFKPMFAGIAEALTPVRLAVGGIAGALGALALAFYQGSEESKKFNNAMILTGGYAGMSEARFNGLARSISDNYSAAIGGVREAMQQLVSSGQFTNVSLQSVASTVTRIASLSGQTASEVAQSLIPSLDGSASSARKLNETYHFLTIEQYKYIELLNEQGKTQEAIKYTTEALNKQLDSQATHLGYIEKLWKGVKNAASDFWDWAKSIGREEDPTITLLKAQSKKLEELFASPQLYDKAVVQRALDEYKRLAALVQKEEEKIQADAAKKAKDTKKIKNYSEAGGIQKERQIAREIADVKAQAEYEAASYGLNRIAQLELTKQRELAMAKNEQDQKNADERFEFSIKRADLLKEKEKQIIAKANREKSDIQRDELKKYTDKIRAEDEEIQKQQELYDIYQKNVLISQMDLDVALSRLKTAQQLAEIQANPLLHDVDKAVLREQMEQAQKRKEAAINQMVDLQRLREMNQTIYSSMGSAIDNFVRTGKFAFKDFARSIIQDLLAIQMKAQMLSMFKGFKFFGASSGDVNVGTVTGSDMMQAFADGGNPPVGVPSLVGERGPELFVPHTAGTIIPNDKLSSLGEPSQVVNYNGPYIANMSAIDTQSATQFLAKNKQTIWAVNQSAQRSLPVSR